MLQKLILSITLKTRHGKSRKHASNACGQFLRKLWTFFVKQQFSPINAHKSALLSTINAFLFKNIWYNRKIAILGTFICLGSIWICGHFSTLKIGLRAKNNLFHVCLCSISNFASWKLPNPPKFGLSKKHPPLKSSKLEAPLFLQRTKLFWSNSP